MAKRIKLHPAPRLEIRIYVSDQMVADLKECKRLAQVPGDGKDCDTCSWSDVEIDDADIGMCELPEVCRQVLGEEDEHGQIDV